MSSSVVIELAQDSSSAEVFEARALELLQREVGCDVAFFSTKGTGVSPAVIGFDERAIERAARREREYSEDLLPVKRAALAARGVAVDTDVLGIADVHRTRYFREIAKPLGGRHTLMAYVPWQGRTVSAVMLGRTGVGFSPGAVRRIESLLPALGVARASFGLPCQQYPLRPRSSGRLLDRLGLGPRSRVLDSVPLRVGELVVRDRGGYREMVASHGEHELVWTRVDLDHSSASGWPYVDLFHVAAALAAQRRRVLFVGCGGAVAVRQFADVYPGIHIDVVECEPAVFGLARSWFALDAIPGVQLHEAEGAEFIVRARPNSWDVVIVDAYDANDLGTPFAQPRFFAALRRALAPGGAMAMNVIGRLAGPGPVREVVRAARRELGDVRVVPVMDVDEASASDALRNVVVVARARSALW